MYEQPKIKVPKFEEAQGFYTTPERSELMRKIRSKNSRPEVALRKALWHFGFRYRCHPATVTGKPDISFARWKIAIFVDGDFWHGYNWAAKKEKIKANRDFWQPKIERNIQRDAEVNLKLEGAGWKVIRVWEHELNRREFGATVFRLVKILGLAAGHLEFYIE